MTKTTATLAAALLFTGCDALDGGWDDLFDTDDTFDDGFYEGDALIAQVDFGCDVGSPDMWWFQSVNEGWAGDMTLDIYETGDGNWPDNPGAVWEERHNMTNSEWAEDGTWDQWDLDLRSVGSPGAQVGGNSTLFGCRWNDGRSLAFMLTLHDDDGRAQDCAIWGRESHQYFNVHRGESCVCFDGDGSCTN